MLFCLVMLAACAGDADTPKLSGATRSDIPVFEPSVVEKSDTFAYSTGSDFYDLQRHEGVSWDLSTQRPLAELIAFYERVAIAGSDGEEGPGEEGEEGEGEEEWGEEQEQEPEPDEAEDGADGKSAALLDMPGRVFRIETKNKVSVEITVYLRPLQRRVWFTILESAPVDS